MREDRSAGAFGMMEFLAVIGGLCLGGFVLRIILRGVASSRAGAPDEEGRSRDVQRGAFDALVKEVIPSITDEDLTAWRLVRGARQCLAFGALGALPSLDEFAREMLADLYGAEWVQENEEILQSMLVYVEEFRLLNTQDLRQFAAEDAKANVLLCIAVCIQCLGIFRLPTLPKGEPSPSDFVLAFSGGDLMASMSDPSATAHILQLAVAFAREAASSIDAA
jgi:hypothetical protein